MFFRSNDDSEIDLPDYLRPDFEIIMEKLSQGESVVFSHFDAKDNYKLTLLVYHQIKSLPAFKGKKIYLEDPDKIMVSSQSEFEGLVLKWKKQDAIVIFSTPEYLLQWLDTGKERIKFDNFFDAVAKDKIQFFVTIDPDGRFEQNYKYLKGVWLDFVHWKEYGVKVQETIMESKVVQEHKTDIRLFNSDLKKLIIGQDNAIDTISGTVKKHYAGLSDPQKPIGVFYFVGPSGVGKTELARQLAKFLYGHEDCMKRIDMSEFSDDIDINRLIGSAPGYVGYDRGGALTEWVKKNPQTIVLMDEFEKSHWKCWDVCLQMFDAGRLTDGKGDTVDFTKTIIIMTSNIGSELFFESGITDQKEIYSNIIALMRKQFRPEFLNRIDEIVMFEPLNETALYVIARKILAKKFPGFKVEDEVINFLVSKGYEPAYGVRFLSRAIDDYIVEPFADLIIKGHVAKDSKLKLELANGSIIFKT